MIDHISLAVRDISRAVAFYEPVLETLGWKLLVTRERAVGFGKDYPVVWLNLREGLPPVTADSGAHIALRARSVAHVQAFHAAVVAAGGRSESPPSHRPHDRVRYYATFVVDPDGNRIEAVTFPADDQV